MAEMGLCSCAVYYANVPKLDHGKSEFLRLNLAIFFLITSCMSRKSDILFLIFRKNNVRLLALTKRVGSD